MLRRVLLELVESYDGLTPVTDQGGGQPQISKAGGAFANTTNTLLHVGNGLYSLSLTADDLDTLGAAVVRYQGGTAAEAKLLIQVVAANVYESARQQWNDHP